MSSTAEKKAALFAHLKVSILTLALPPGSDLDETDLSEAFGLSRTPLREVLREMAGAGYVSFRTNRGAQVAEMSHASLRDFFLAAPMVYGAILRLAARHASAEQIANLRDAQSDFCTALGAGNAADRTLANARFHEITGDMAGNVYLRPSFHRLLIDHARIGMTFYGAGSADESHKARDQHDQIIEAITNKDEDQAALLADAHWALSRDQIARFVMPAPVMNAQDTPSLSEAIP